MRRVVAATALVGLGCWLLGACVSRNVEEIGPEEAAAIPPPPPPVAPLGRTAAEPAAARISGTVEVAPGLAGRLPAGGVLYLIVRVAGREGGPPLAVKRLPPTLPTGFTITDGDAMVPGTPLVGQVSLVARLDQDGDALTTSPGDLVGRAGPVEVGAGAVIVVLDEVVGSASGGAGEGDGPEGGSP